MNSPAPLRRPLRGEGELFAALRSGRSDPPPPPGKLVFVAAAEVEGIDALRHSLGYALANRLMNAICERIEESVDRCEVGRSGRACVDFAFAAASRQEAQIALARIATSAGQVIVDGFEVDLALTIGVAVCGASGAAEALELAEAALAEAQQRRMRVAFADELGSVAGIEHVSLARDLQTAIGAGELALVYQPKVDARTCKVRAAEALVRWQHPRLGSVSPAVFVSLAEETGIIRSLTEWTLRRAIEDRRAIVHSGHEVAVHINLSGHLLGDLNFTAWALSALGDVAPQLGFEITETAMIRDPEQALRNLQLYAEAGVHLYVDDYGSGFSSLAYLQKLPVRELKIDQSFITHLATSHRDPLLVRSTIDLAHALDMKVTAEGVETPEVLALLQIMGCDFIQGYVISRPLSLDSFIAFCDRGTDAPSVPHRWSLPRFRAAGRP